VFSYRDYELPHKGAGNVLRMQDRASAHNISKKENNVDNPQGIVNDRPIKLTVNLLRMGTASQPQVISTPNGTEKR
jgi:hypothetical protein